jgi:hypothetical protein
MEVIAHQAPAEEIELLTSGLEFQSFQEEPPAFVGKENLLPIIPALCDVVGKSRHHHPRYSGHIMECKGAQVLKKIRLRHLLPSHLLPRIEVAVAVCVLAATFSSSRGLAAVHKLDAPRSRVQVEFDDARGRIVVTEKLSGWKWVNPQSGGNPLTISAIADAGPLKLSANATTSAGYPVTVSLELVPASGDLVVTISGAATAIPAGIIYPNPFFAMDGSGFSVFPTHGGYVIPATATETSRGLNAFADNQMEWFGGTDAANQRAWIAVVETPDDWSLNAVTGAIGEKQVIGAAPKWLGSNGNSSHTPNLVSYERRLRYHFFSSGGYVALAKHFRRYAMERGWFKSLKSKIDENPLVERLIGAPVIYLWGDGRSKELLAELQESGIRKALIQISVNHADHTGKFPNAEFPENDGWAREVHQRGYLAGFYDIYRAVSPKPGPVYDGYHYLWPADSVSKWSYVNPGAAPGRGAEICAQMQADFARATRLPALVSRFDIDAYFFDTTNAVAARECYSPLHFATRAQDKANRARLLDTAYSHAPKRLVTGTEQGRSYGVPFIHWAEGKILMGGPGALRALGQGRGGWDDNAYPSIMIDPIDPTRILRGSSAYGNGLAALLADGYQAPLWDLVYHDAVVTTVHWSMPHNKYLYTWDHADLMAMLRGQAPLLNLAYRGQQGSARRTPGSLQDHEGKTWNNCWTSARERVLRTYVTVCRWQEKVALLEMTDHRWLTQDRSVQMTEFSGDGGRSGHGIVDNFGVYDGAYGVTGQNWQGTLRKHQLQVPPGQFRTYDWGNSSATPARPQ